MQNVSSSCANLTIEDKLGAFDWICDASSGTATFYTARLKEGKGLKDLINGTTGTAFNNNSITIYSGNSKALTSTPAIWWTNTVTLLPDNHLITDPGAVLSAPSTIYTLLSSTTSSGYNIDADKVALVLLNGATLSYSGNAGSNYDHNTGEAVGVNDIALISSGAQKFLWLEGAFDSSGGAGANAVDGISLFTAAFSRVNNVSNKNGTCTGLAMTGCINNFLTDIKISKVGACWLSGLLFENASKNNLVIGATLNNNILGGLGAYDLSDQNVFYKINASNNGNGTADGINIYNSNSNILVGATVANSSNTSIRVHVASTRNTISHVIVPNSRDESFTIEGAGTDYNTINQVVRANGGSNWGGLYLANGSTNTIVSQLASASSNGYGVELEDTSFNQFTNNLLLGNNPSGDCYVSAVGSNKGMVDTSCANQGTSNANLVNTGINISNSFLGKVTTDDFINTSDTNGSRAIASILDWIGFENPFRTWGRDGGAFPALSNTNGCTAGTCRIWDWRLNASDSIIRNKSNDGSTLNAAFVPGSTCPAAVNGTKTLTDQQIPPHTFLFNATEIAYDPIRNPNGNNNGLCESGEGCIYSPNFGAYQGEGVLVGPCVFQNGTVTGVTMYAYSINGVGLPGTLDTSLNSSGVVQADLVNGTSWESGNRVRALADGKILVFGDADFNVGESDFFVTRYNSDGTLDTTFGTAGKSVIHVSDYKDEAFDMAIQRDGKIVLVGTSWFPANRNMSIVRLNGNGSIDSSFGNSGIVILDWGYGDDDGWTVAVQNDGKILVGGDAHDSLGNWPGAIARLHPDGTLDNTFGTGGKKFPHTTYIQDVFKILIQADDQIIIAGSVSGIAGCASYCMMTARLNNSNGSLDTTYDTDGLNFASPVTYSHSNSLGAALQSDGKIVVVGVENNQLNAGVVSMIRFNTDGSLDTTFDTDGKVQLNLAGMTAEGAWDVAIQPDGRILLAGDDYTGALWPGGAGAKGFVARYLSNGSLDTSFATGGIYTIDLDSGAQFDRVRGITLAPDQRIIVTGGFGAGGATPHTTLFRLWP